jgi:hypothetical protein
MNNQVFKQVAKLATQVKQDLRKKGLVVPRDNGNGTITVDRFTIVKEDCGSYTIRDSRNDIIVEQINLAQTAVLLANGLALGRWLDLDLVKQDKAYGYGLFEETLTKRHAETSLKTKDVDRATLMYTKASIARQKKVSAKTVIMNSFEKLRRLR